MYDFTILRVMDGVNLTYYKILSWINSDWSKCPDMSSDFEDYIKDTKEDELADFLIRIMDFWGSENWYLVDRVEDYLSIAKEQFGNSEGMAYLLLNKYSYNFPSFVYNVTRSMPLQENIEQRDANSLHDMCSIFYCILKYCEQQNIDILFHIEEKLKYNATRPRKHGKKY